MPRKNKEQEIIKKLEYIGLNLEEVPETLRIFDNLNFRTTRKYDERKYKQYRYISPKEIDILLSPTNRLNDIKEKYEKASPVISYLIPDNEENIAKHAKFLEMLKEVKIEEIEKVEEEQQELSKKIPFSIKYEGNYLWQIYYSESAERYFMIVPTEDKDYSTFFYVLKKQLEKKKAGKIFVPISYVDYSREFYNKQEFENIENYLWVLTKDWPSIYEVYDKTDKLSIHIVGETHVYEQIKTDYKVKLTNKIEATKFYKLLKALFILQTELPHYYKFDTQINKLGELEFYYNDEEIKYDDLTEWIHNEYVKYIKLGQKMTEEQKVVKEKLEKLKQETMLLDIEYVNKEKQISTFLECKKSFFGKVKYFFKYSGKKNKKKTEKKEEKTTKVEEQPKEIINENEVEKKQYTLDELIEKGKKINELETNLKNEKMDVNALKLRNKNLQKKIENAESFIAEIDSHKKSIFEFWKYSNKDERQALMEGEEEFVDVKPISAVFDYKEDLDELGEELDNIQRKKLTKQELDAIYVTTTNITEIINKIKTEEVPPKELEKYLKELKQELKQVKSLEDDEEFDIFGGLTDNPRKVQNMSNKKHREIPKDKFNILEIDKSTKTLEFKMALTKIAETTQTAIQKIEIGRELPVYKITEDNQKIDVKQINIFNFNPETEIKKVLEKEDSKANLYKINLKKDTKILAFTNSVYYDNQNRTLPVGMNLDSRAIIDLNNVEIKLNGKKIIRIAKEKEGKIEIKTINIL